MMILGSKWNGWLESSDTIRVAWLLIHAFNEWFSLWQRCWGNGNHVYKEWNEQQVTRCATDNRRHIDCTISRMIFRVIFRETSLVWIIDFEIKARFQPRVKEENKSHHFWYDYETWSTGRQEFPDFPFLLLPGSFNCLVNVSSIKVMHNICSSMQTLYIINGWNYVRIE